MIIESSGFAVTVPTENANLAQLGAKIAIAWAKKHPGHHPDEFFARQPHTRIKSIAPAWLRQRCLTQLYNHLIAGNITGPNYAVATESLVGFFNSPTIPIPTTQPPASEQIKLANEILGLVALKQV